MRILFASVLVLVFSTQAFASEEPGGGGKSLEERMLEECVSNFLLSPPWASREDHLHACAWMMAIYMEKILKPVEPEPEKPKDPAPEKQKNPSPKKEKQPPKPRPRPYQYSSGEGRAPDGPSVESQLRGLGQRGVRIGPPESFRTWQLNVPGIGSSSGTWGGGGSGGKDNKILYMMK